MLAEGSIRAADHRHSTRSAVLRVLLTGWSALSDYEGHHSFLRSINEYSNAAPVGSFSASQAFAS